uniref:Low affinity immunoglobulin epsilon Fc receptor n=1 Tax=uncultured bacterium lac111 TaxID=1447235 RepID=X2LC35_9BACT|nr:Low affinity immunoglobulin epsilon Fc receptor [uncultured bacterium lac111]
MTLAAACGRSHFEARDDAPGVELQDAEIAVDAQLSSDAPQLVLDAGECPTAYTRVGTSCYRFSGGQVPTWLDGELACEADGVGAHMVTVDDVNEGNLLKTTFAINDYWSGMSDRVTEGQYRNVTGELAPYLVWVPGEPTSSDCAQFDDAGLFHVSTCDTSDEYLCEFDGRPAAAGAY